MYNNFSEKIKSRGSAGIILPAAALFIILILTACGTKKNTPLSRNWQAFTTRYNVYYNGSEHMKETLAELEKSYEDDYTRTLLVHPAEARANEKLPQPTGDFKRTIEKMQKAIQLHSIKKKPRKRSGSQKEKEFRAREEFNPFLHNAWLSLGKAQFYNGDFLGAAATFFYISKHFKWLPDVVTEAMLYQAWSYAAMDWNYEAENALNPVKEKNLTNSRLRNLYNLVKADFLVRTNRWQEAVPFLSQAAKSAKGNQKNRLWFLLGQVYSNLGNRQMAYNAFARAGSGSSTPYRTKFNARIKQSEVFSGSNIRKEVNSLKAMTKYERNKEYFDQIYYAIGNLYLSRKDTAEAKKNYILAVENSTRDGIDKALAQLALGNIYFNEGDYVKAQPCYSEAITKISDNYPDFRNLKRRSDVLDELAVYAGNVDLQDSLLNLAAMTPDDREKACRRLADEFVKKEKEEREIAEQEEYLASQEGAVQMNTGNKGPSSAPQQFLMNSDKSWYFYNAMTKNAGKTEFQRKWGARKLEDDWRRRNKTTFSFDETADSDGGQGSQTEGERNDSIPGSGGETDKKTQDPRQMEYYLAQIPSTPEQIKTANDVVQEGLYNMGLILKDKLEDFPAARSEFLTLERRYPDNIYRLDVYYNLYLMAVRADNRAEAETWRSKIISDFPESPYGQAMRDPDYFDNLRKMNSMQESLYADAYKAYLDNENATVHSLTGRMEKDFPLSAILPKFVFIDALSYLTEDDTDKFRERLTTLLQKWPDTDMTDMAGGIMRGLQAGRKPHAGISNSRGMIWEMRLSNDTLPLNPDGTPANFKYDPDAPQYLVLAFPRDSVNSNEVLFEVARFNFSSFVVKDFDMEPMSFGNVGLLIIKGFDNLRQLEHYRDIMAKSKVNISPLVRPIMISKENFELLLREGRSFEEYFRYEEEEKEKITEETITDEENLVKEEAEAEGEMLSQ